ncbi:MAG: hypothetical protein D6737_03245 [Chloroflexi bacterium]|nr:MAG: hypothetical protein CUN54_04475 [Phototrophicales bacterium]RMF82021.1 MAG: hypothetical protein D6737_03245 [Chloroflexota bacterium]
MTDAEVNENEAVTQNADDSEQGFPWLLLLIGIAGIALGIFIATQVIGILFAIISPPDAPLPANITLVQHDNQSYGVDEWTYDSADSPCDVLEFYQEAGGICRVPPTWCVRDENGVLSIDDVGVPLTATCTGSQEFSIFAMRWRSSISASSIDGPTSLQVFREVLWGGSPIEATPTP